MSPIDTSAEGSVADVALTPAALRAGDWAILAIGALAALAASVVALSRSLVAGNKLGGGSSKQSSTASSDDTASEARSSLSSWGR